MKEHITLAHGNGGTQMQSLLHECVFSALENTYLAEEEDGALLPSCEGFPVVTTDGYTVKPLFFPGGDIGHLAVCGTVNDLAVMGAKPVALTLSMIIEAGMSTELLQRVLLSIRKTADIVGVPIVTGDTKVVEPGAADTLFLTTSGFGWKKFSAPTGWRDVKKGDEIIVSGTIGHHGVAILAAREELPFTTELKSDAVPLNKMLLSLCEQSCGIRWIRDATRGGVAAVLNELVRIAKITIEIKEADVPVADDVRGAAEILGLDPLYLANEGRCVIVCDSKETKKVLEVLHGYEEGATAQTIGKVTEDGLSAAGRVVIETAAGSRRIVEMPSGEQLPRIC